MQHKNYKARVTYKDTVDDFAAHFAACGLNAAHKDARHLALAFGPGRRIKSIDLKEVGCANG